MYEHEKHLVGVYDTENEAIKVVEDLKRQGYATNEISVIGKDRTEGNTVLKVRIDYLLHNGLA